MCRADRYCRVYIDEVADMAERMGCRVIRNRNGVSLHYPDRVKRQKRLEKKREAQRVGAES
ncbi:MAG: hypothetical protein AB7F40_11385 [Victivallaceae bacterium]